MNIPKSTPVADILNPPLSGLEKTQRVILAALQGKQLYAGTVPGAVKAKRRAANKVASASRKANR